MTQDLLDLVRLLDLDRYADRIHRRLDKALLVLSSGDDDGVEQQLLGSSDLYFGLVVSLHGLGREVSEAEGAVEGAAHGIEIGLESVGLDR